MFRRLNSVLFCIEYMYSFIYEQTLAWQVIYDGFILCSLTLTGLAGFINYALIGAKHDTIDRMGQSTGQLPLDESANYGVMIAGLS